MPRSCYSLMVCAAALLLLAGCANGKSGRNAGGGGTNGAGETGNTNSGDTTNSNTSARERGYLLSVRDEVGRKVRTTRSLEVSEAVEGRMLIQRKEEIYQQKTIRVGAGGLAVEALRDYESSQAGQWFLGDLTTEMQSLPLEGESVRLIQRDGAIVKEPLNKEVSASNLDKLQIAGFDSSLLPTSRVAPGDFWQIDLEKVPEFARLLEALGIETESHLLRAKLFDLTNDYARIQIEWQVNAKPRGGVPLVLQLSGSMTLDRAAGLITSVKLSGGTQLRGGGVQHQIEMSIERKVLKSWYD